MTLLRRYVLAAFARIFALSLAAFTGIYLLVDFFEKVDDFIEHQARLAHYVLYFVNKIPLIVTQVAPMAVLLGVFLTLGGFSRTSELTAMRAGGLSLWRISAPLLGGALLLALAVLGAGEFLVPLSTKKINHILYIEIKGKPELVLKRDRLWFREGGTVVNVRLAEPERGVLEGVTLLELDDGFRLRSRTDAARAVFDGNGWTFEDLTIRRFDPVSGELSGLDRLARQKVELAKVPEDFRATERRHEELGIRDLRRLARKLQEEGYDATRHRVDLQERLASPFACLVMAFLGIPFALRRGRGTSLAAGVTVSVAIGIAYHILHAALLAFGYSAALPPVAAAWGAGLLFGLLGVWLLLSARQ